MISIRKNCFETNSSSMHSIAITKNPLPYRDYDKLNYLVKEDGLLDLFYLSDDDEMTFERYPFRVLRSETDKVRYILGYYYSWDGAKTKHKKEIKAIHKLIKQKYPEIKEIKDWDDGHDWNGKPRKNYPQTSFSNDTGEDVFEFIKRKELTMEDVIFNPAIVIIVDGDEYQETYKLFDSGIISEDWIEDISSGINHWMRREFTFDIGMIDWTYQDGSTYRDSRLELIMQCRNIEKATVTLEFDCRFSSEGITSESLYEMAAPYIHKILDAKATIIVNNSVDQELYKKYILDTYISNKEV